MNSTFFTALIAAGLIFSLSAQAQVAPVADAPVNVASRHKKVLLIGIDGTRPDILEKATAPNLQELMKTGVYSRAATRVPTNSGPGWSSMLTGVWPEKHGVRDNNFTDKKLSQYPDFLTRIETANTYLTTFAAVGWAPLVATNQGGPAISDAIDVKFSTKDGDHNDNDRMVAAVATTFLSRENVDAAFVQFDSVDHAGHVSNPLSEKYAAALTTVDGYIGNLLAAIRSRPNYAREDWLILVSTDHGFTDGGSHGGDSKEQTTIWFIANGPNVDAAKLQAPVEIVDIGVTALAHMGITADTKWGLDGRVQGLKTP